MSSGTVHDWGSSGAGHRFPARAASSGWPDAPGPEPIRDAVATTTITSVRRCFEIMWTPRNDWTSRYIAPSGRARRRRMRQSRLMRVAVVGHVEWVEFVRVATMPVVGEIVHAEDWWEEPGGGGAGAAVQLRKLAGRGAFYTALG